MASPFVFVNVTHPAHMRGTRIRKQVKSHTSRHNIRKTLQKKEKASAHSQQSASALPRHQSHPGDFQPALCFFSTTTPSVSSSESDDAIDQDDVKSSSLIRQPQDKHIEFLDCYQVFGIGHVSHLWSYFINVFGPARTWRPEMVDGGAVEDFKQSVIEFTLDDALSLESMLMMCMATIELHANPQAPKSKTLILHYSRLMQMIQQRFQQRDYNDGTVMALLRLLMLCCFYCDWRSFESNYVGFRRLLQLRGGLDKLKWPAWSTYGYIWVQMRWMNHLAQLKAAGKLLSSTPLTYPSHPYPAKVCLLIAKLPIGFQDMLLDRHISLEVVEALARITVWSAKIEQADTSDPTHQAQLGREGITLSLSMSEYLASSDLGAEEHLLCIGLMSYIFSLDFQNIRDPRGLDEHLKDVLALYRRSKLAPFPDLLAWLAVVLATTEDSYDFNDVDNGRWALIDHLVAEEEEGLRSWDAVRPRLARFLFPLVLEGKWRACWNMACERGHGVGVDGGL